MSGSKGIIEGNLVILVLLFSLMLWLHEPKHGTHMYTELYQGQYLSFDTEDVNIGGLASRGPFYTFLCKFL